MSGGTWARRAAQVDQLLALVAAAEAREQSTILMVRTVRHAPKCLPVLGAAINVPGFEPLRGEVVRVVPHGTRSHRVTLRVECAHVRAAVRP